VSEFPKWLGAVVRLKHGGPIMTVIYECEDDENRLECAWFDTSTKLQTSRFCPEALLMRPHKAEPFLGGVQAVEDSK